MTLQDEPSSVTALAQRCWRESVGNLDKAASLMRQAIEADARLLHELMEPFIESAIRTSLKELMRGSRAGYFHAMANRDDASGLRALAAQARDYYGYPLSGGTLLGDADHAQIMSDASLLLAQSKTLNTRGLMLKHIAKKIPEGKTVRDVLTEEQLKRIFGRFSC